MHPLTLNFLTKLIIPLLLVLGACTKNVAGPKGDPGEPGKKGNLRQTYISEVKVDSLEWRISANHRSWEYLVVAGEITEEKLKKSEVKVYLEKDGAWWCLAHIANDVYVQYNISQGIVRLSSYELHGGAGVRPPTSKFRIVILLPA